MEVVVEVAVVLLDLDHRQPAPLSVQLIAQPGECLLLDQECLARSQPLSTRYDSRICYLARCHDQVSCDGNCVGVCFTPDVARSFFIASAVRPPVEVVPAVI